MAKRAWHIEETVTELGEAVPAYDQVVDLVGSLLDTLRVVGGQLSVATVREDTDERVAGVKKFETVGYLVTWTDAVPGVKPAAPAPAVELEVDDEIGEGE